MRFIHIADVHLGARPDREMPWSAEREKEVFDTFRALIARIQDDPVDILLIAGDLFHRQPLLGKLKEVDYLFRTIPATRIYLSAGNHDYIRKDSSYNNFVWADNVFFFREEEVQVVKDPLLDVFIYGFSYHSREIREDILEGLEAQDENGVHILMAHGGDDRHVPFNVRELLNSGFDYVALGHIHKPSVIVRNRAAYPGALEPIDRDDFGEHGYIEGVWQNGRLSLSFVPFACRSYEQIILEVDETSTQNSLEDALREEIKDRGEENMYRVILHGYRSPDLLLIPERFFPLGQITEVENETRPMYNMEEIRRHYSGTLIGDYINAFQGRELSLVEEKALYYGVQALMETSRVRRY